MLLTLAIPTYNRAERLRETLLEFVAQIKRAALTDVEIVVSDNCSTDATPEVVASISTTHPDICVRYFRNASNLGFDGNVNALFGRAEGRYVWTFSDDDHPTQDALPYVVSLLRQRDIRFAFVNYQVSIEGRMLQSRFGAGPDRWLRAPDLLKTILFSNSLISASVFARQAWLDAKPQRYVGSLWIHFFVAREILQTGDALIVGRPQFTMQQSSLEKSRAEKQNERSGEIEYYMQAHLKFVQYASELNQFRFDQATCSLAETLGQREDIHQVINFKLTAKNYNIRQILKTWRRLFEYRTSKPTFWLIVTPLLFSPNQFVKLLRTIARRLRG